jgi:TfoX/Sxy family transcriptional regulator of competence genes
MPITTDDEIIVARIRQQMAGVAGLTEKRMFGGLAFLVRGNMSIGVNRGELMVRADPAEFEELTRRRGARPMDFTGRPMRGWIAVASGGFTTDDDLASWVDASLEFVLALPGK